MKKKSCKDHLGQEFKSITAMCKHWGITTGLYYHRRKAGMSLENTLTAKINVSDHLGQQFNTTSAMCDFWDIDVQVYYNRIHRGWSLEQALTTDKQSTEVTDHLGNVFSGVTELCKYYNLDYSTYKRRITNGWSLEDTLTVPRNEHNSIAITDHLGQHFSSIREMCNYWNIKPGTYANRIRRGFSIKDALMTPVNKKQFNHRISKNKTIRNSYETINDMCISYNIKPATVYHRLSKGWTLEDALTIPVKTPKIAVRDPYGQTFDSITKLCEHYNVPRKTYQNRINNGYTSAQALNLIPLIKSTSNNVIYKDIIIKFMIEPGYYLCSIDNHDVVLQEHELLLK